MSNIGVLVGIILKVLLIGAPIVLLFLAYSSRKSLMKMIFIVPLLVGSLIVAFCFFNSGNDSKRKESKKYLGYYKLDRLNGENCENCKLNLLEDNHYDIIVNNQIKGRGKWDLDFDGESAGYYLVLENGPHNMIFDTPREIGYINTKDR